jgi:High-affinity nickel-transport protein
MNTPPAGIPSRGAVLTASSSPRTGRLVRQSFAAMSPVERTRVLAMYGVIAGLHVAGFGIVFVFVVPSHYQGLGIGVAVLAYTLGLRHAFDADHISAIDNTTRKVLGDRQGTSQPRPFGFGFFFSLGHSSVVVAIGVAIIVAEKTVFAAVADSGSALERFGGVFGTVVSASFLLLIGLLNLVILAGIVRVFQSMRRRAPGGRQPQAPTRKALTPCDGVERPLPHHRPALPQPAHGRRAPLQDARRIRIQPSSPAGRRPARAGGADARLCRRHDGRAAGLPRPTRRARAYARRLQVLPRQRMSRDPWVTRRGERRRSNTTPAGRPDPAPRR